MFRRIALLCLSASLAAASDVTGLWQLTVKVPGGNDQVVDLSFSRANGKLAGTVGKGGMSIPLQAVTENGAEVSFQVPNDDGVTYSVRLTLAGDTLSGTFSAPQGMSGACTGARKVSAAPLAPAVADFLAKNNQPLDVTNPQAGLLDTAGKQIFLLGESHGLTINEDLDLALLRYLHKTAGVRVYIAEWGYAASCLMNRYIETGDERLLDFMMRQSRGSVSWTKEHRAYLVKFREWSLTLPERDRVRIVGLDIEHQTQIAAWYLHELAAGAREAPASIRDMASTLAQLDAEKTPDSVIRKLAADLSAGLAAHRSDYAGWLGDRLLEFDVVATNLKNRYEAYADREKQFDVLREAAMYDTFLKLQPMLAGVKCYGRWGAAHVAQRRFENRDPLAARLNRPDSPVAGKVVTIWPLHQDCEALQMAGGSYRTRAFSDESPLMKPLADNARAPLTLFKLTGADSPFAKTLYHFTAGSGGVTTDYAQYFVLIRGATPSHLMEGSAQAAGARPYVVKTEPAAESRDVAPGVLEIKVTFSQEMQPKSFSFVRSMAGQQPQFAGEPVLDSTRRTYAVTVKVEPGKVYAVWLNSERAQSFHSAAGDPAVPYLLVFQTKNN
jgi:erythromycin esterase